ncbi:hypothetical protein L593_00105 [Salinarchaeum sp. Harcht-Bsk1]|uniref:hypothetical protein n=1 Tax=Salinarchaeum sp. Harcht-Bsk1 TaxID=1333523 RepID=UPI0003424331|nr:hypothetical protein [Salinarchaeum sp. Harcht-Bsk1]AGM99975.1 hypothetical protein L593_00105 [Salinarchaeum sp. Harcht-Bsk1]
MSWSRSSKLGLAVLLLFVLAAVGVASAVSVTPEQAPEEAEVGQNVTIQVELQDLYAESSSWNFDGQTVLENATWTVEEYQGSNQVDTHTFQGQSPPNGEVTIDQSASDAPDRLVVEISGTVPIVDSYSYENPATFLGAELVRVASDGSGFTTIQEYQIHHYTTDDPGSAEARTALDDARSTIDAAASDGSDVSEAESTFDDAVSAYDSGNFADAVSLAEESASQAESSSSDGGSGSDDSGSSDDGSTDGGSTNGTDTTGGDTGDQSGSDGSQTDSSQTSDGGQDADGNSSSNDSDDGGLLMPILYALLGALILGVIVGGFYWYQQQNQGPNRDPLG